MDSQTAIKLSYMENDAAMSATEDGWDGHKNSF